MMDIKYKISDIYVNGRILKKLEKRKEELDHYYGEIIIRKDSLSLLNLLPKRIINVTHKLPLKILAFSDYHVQDFKPLLEYVKNLKEKPDIIVYAGDAVDRFGPLPLKMLNLKSDKGELYPSIFDVACLSYKDVHEDSRVLEPCSKQYGFILRMPKKLKINVKEKLKQIINIYSKIQNFKNISKSFQTFKSLIQDLPVRIEEIKLKETHIWENSLSRIINLVDTQTQLKIYSIKEEELFYSSSIYDDFYEIYKNVDFYKIPINKLKSDKKYIYYFIPNPERPEKNIFEELAKNSRYGVVAVLGNNEDFIISKTLINGKKVFDASSTLIKIGPILIIGIEGDPSDTNCKLRLEFIQKHVAKDEFIIIVSHVPPKDILDRAIRSGGRSIGSVALRDYIEEDPRVGLVICGHVHNQGGKFEVLNNTTVVNVSSQDTPFDKANVAWITIDENKKVHVKIEKLPSLIEQIFKEDGRNIKENLINKVNLSESEAELFLNFAKTKGTAFFEDLPNLESIKIQLGLPWQVILSLYEKGIKEISQIQEKTFTDMYQYIPHEKGIFLNFAKTKGTAFFEDLPNLKSIKIQLGLPWQVILLLYEKGIKEISQIQEKTFTDMYQYIPPLYRMHWKRAYAKFKRERSNEVYLMNQLPINTNKVIIFDTEYSPDKGKGVLYGFLDKSEKEIKQFWLNEKPAAFEYVRSKAQQGYVFVHWGGADRKLLREELGINAQTFNLLYFCQTSLVAPVNTFALEEVYDTLNVHNNDEWWNKYFYSMDGLIKASLCNKILEYPNEEEPRKTLSEANKADILALEKILKALQKLPVKPSNPI